MSGEPSKLNGQQQTEENAESHQLGEIFHAFVEPGDCGISSTLPKREGEPDQGLSNRLGSEADSCLRDPVRQTTAEIASGREQSDPPSSGSGEQTQRTSGSATGAEELPKDDPDSRNDPDSHLNEADRLTPTEFADVELSATERILDKLAFFSYDQRLGAGNVRDLEHEEVDFQPSPTHDLVRRGGSINLGVVSWFGSQSELTTYDSDIRKDGKHISVPQMPPALSESMLLPTEVVGHYAAQDVFDSIFAVLQQVSLLSEKQCELLTCWCMAGWFVDVLPFIPRLTITGPKYAADVLVRALRCVCRRPVLLAGITPAILKSIPISDLMPTLFILETNPSKRASALLEASDHRGYLVAAGGQMHECYCLKCVYIGEAPPKPTPEGIHVHLARNAPLPLDPLPSNRHVQWLQNLLFSYRCFNLERVTASEFTAHDLLPELDAVARPLAAVMVDDFFLQGRVVELLKESNEQARVDRSSGLKGVVVRAVLSHCHQNDLRVFAREIAATVNGIYHEAGESLKVSSETVGHVLKSLGLYSRQLGNGGRGLMLDRSTQVQVHELGRAYEVLPAVPDCGYCHRLQSPQSEEVV